MTVHSTAGTAKSATTSAACVLTSWLAANATRAAPANPAIAPPAIGHRSESRIATTNTAVNAGLMYTSNAAPPGAVVQPAVPASSDADHDGNERQRDRGLLEDADGTG